MVYLTKPSATFRLPLPGKLSGGYKVFFLIFFLIVMGKNVPDAAWTRVFQKHEGKVVIQCQCRL
jgi:hypothetical protein